MKNTQVKNKNIIENLDDDLIYEFQRLCEICAERVRIRKDRLKIKDSDICEPPYIISRIIHNQIDKERNPYLIPPKIMLGNNNYKNRNVYKGIYKSLKFENPLEVLIGDKGEQEIFIYSYYKMIKKWYLISLKDNEILNNVLSKHIIITYYLTYLNNNINPDDYCSIINLKSNRNNESNFIFFKTKASEYLYNDIEDDFIKIFYYFAGNDVKKQANFYKNFCNHTKDIFIENYFMNLLKYKYKNPNPICTHLKNVINDSLQTYKIISKDKSEIEKKKLLITSIKNINNYTLQLDKLSFDSSCTKQKYDPFFWSF